MGNDSKHDHEALFIGLLHDLKEDIKDVGEKVEKSRRLCKRFTTGARSIFPSNATRITKDQ